MVMSVKKVLTIKMPKSDFPFPQKSGCRTRLEEPEVSCGMPTGVGGISSVSWSETVDSEASTIDGCWFVTNLSESEWACSVKTSS